MGWMRDVKGLLSEVADNTADIKTTVEDLYTLAEEAQKDAIRNEASR